MDREEAEKMLETLTKFYKEPVMPIGRYCATLRQWQSLLRQRAERELVRLYPGASGDLPAQEAAYEAYRKDQEAKDPKLSHLRAYQSAVSNVDFAFLQISKSSFLDRALYGREPLRTEMCPTHKGKWSGLDFNGECPCSFTGWLPAKPNETP